jgi:hypothetical protein
MVHVMLLFFQDLAFHGSPDRRSSLREALIQKAHAPWRHASQREAEMRGHFGGDDVILFEHDATNQLPAAGLTLWQRSDGYEVTNIVPLNSGALSPKEYNDLLNDFARRVGQPAADATSFSLIFSQAEKSLEDVAGVHPAQALRAFVALVDSSHPTAHPLDQKRWHEFLIAEFREEPHMSADTLQRWLHEEAGWPEDDAFELAAQYERGLALLDTYAHETVPAK